MYIITAPPSYGLFKLANKKLLKAGAPLLSLSLSLYIYIYMHTYMHIYVYICMYIYIHTYI